MRSSSQLQSVRQSVERVMKALSSDPNLQGDLTSSLVYLLDQECSFKLNSGRKDIFGSIHSLRDPCLQFFHDHRESFPFEPAGLEDPVLREELFVAVVAQLVADGDILRVSDRLRARSRVFEMVHYLRHLRQRTHRGEKEGYRAGLVEMAKVEVRRRERPHRTQTLSDFCSRLDVLNDYDPLSEGLLDEFGQLRDAFEGFLRRVFPKDTDRLAQFQADSFEQLLCSALTHAPERKQAYVIAAGTGFGKTEAFLLPLLFYSACSSLKKAAGGRGAAVEGVDGILLYPRRDLCDNQAERVLDYLFHLNAALRAEVGADACRPIRVAIAHSGVDQEFRLRCPACTAEKRSTPEQWTDADEQNGYIRGRFKRGAADWGPEGFYCARKEGEHQETASLLVYQVRDQSSPAEIVITTVDTLHRRLMDRHGQRRIFATRLSSPRFLVLDEMHIYEGQVGSHAANILRRCRQRFLAAHNQEPVLIGASATVGAPRTLAARMFGVRADEVGLIQPSPDEKKTQGLEYFLFLQSPGNRLLEDEAASLDESDGVDDVAEDQSKSRSRFVSEQATVIQAAVCLQHNMKAPAGKGSAKRRTLGFVDSLDTAQRLGSNLDNAEWQGFGPAQSVRKYNNLPLYALRLPTGRPGVNLGQAVAEALREFNGPNSADAAGQEVFRKAGSDCPKHETRDCHQPPHHLLERCERYESGECWYAMGSPKEEGLRPIAVQTHRSGKRAWGDVDRPFRDNERDLWRLLISTSALEVGFDHSELIATWQYHAPPSVASFVQRKGRGGRGVRDYPITMVILGPSPADLYHFQNHHRLVDVLERDLVVYVDELNPSVRRQHLVSAVFDFCVATGKSGAYRIRFEEVLESLRTKELRSWLANCFRLNNRELDDFLHALREQITQVWHQQLATAHLGSGNQTLFPRDLFSMDRDEVNRIHERTRRELEDRAGASRAILAPLERTNEWLTEATLYHRDARGGNGFSIVDFTARVPGTVATDPDLRVPATTIAVPLGGYVQVFEQDRVLASEAADFALNLFLPGGFKIRYDGKLWMAPWNPVPGKPRTHNHTWAATRAQVRAGVEGNGTVSELLADTDAGLVGHSGVLAAVGTDCQLVRASALQVRSLGAGRTRSFQLDTDTLAILPKKPENGGGNFRRLARDPHVSPRTFVLPRKAARWDDVGLPSQAIFDRARYFSDLRLVVGHYANLVHCYPQDGEAETIVVQFWDETANAPLCVSAELRTQAVEFRIAEGMIRPGVWDERVHGLTAFWRRLENEILERLVVRTGLLQNAYMVPGIVEALRWLEGSLQGRRQGLSLHQAVTPDVLSLAAREALSRVQRDPLLRSFAGALTSVRDLAHEIAAVIENVAAWTLESAAATTIGDTLAALLARAVGNKLNISPWSFRRLVNTADGRLVVVLYDDYQGGSGTSRRLSEEIGRWSPQEFLQVLQEELACPAAAMDACVESVLTMPVSPDMLASVAQQGIPEDWCQAPGAIPDRTRRRLHRLLETPALAAFHVFALRERLTLRAELGHEPSALVFLEAVRGKVALDPRAETLRLRFLGQGEDVPELPARLREISPLCLSGCPECLDTSRFDRPFVDRRLLQRILDRMQGN